MLWSMSYMRGKEQKQRVKLLMQLTNTVNGTETDNPADDFEIIEINAIKIGLQVTARQCNDIQYAIVHG